MLNFSVLIHLYSYYQQDYFEEVDQYRC